MDIPVRLRIFLATLAVLGVLIAVATTRPAQAPAGPEGSEAYWRQEIARMGGANAYKLLLAQQATSSEDEQHRVGHVFGRALYAQVGLKGTTVCDEQLSGGCWHELFGAAVSEQGTGVIAQIDETCVKEFSEHVAVICQHGIGHGLVSLFGYDTKNLDESLSECAKIRSLNQFKGCFGGVYMEYNLRTVAGGAVRPQTPGDKYAPCASVAGGYQDACYFWLPQWWREVALGGDQTATGFASLGSYCSGAGEHSAACFKGIGYMAPPAAHFERAQAQALCDAVSKDQAGRDACWSMAKESFPG